MKLTGAEIFVECLKREGVDTIFGYPGGAVLPIYDAIFQKPLFKHVLVRHEQAALHAANGYARSTGKCGVALVTSGPGATNAVTGLTDALMDSVPLLIPCIIIVVLGLIFLVRPIASIKALQGKDFYYPWIGGLIEGISSSDLDRGTDRLDV